MVDCARDAGWVADLQDMSEEDKAALALFGIKPELKLLPRLGLSEAEFKAALQMVSGGGKREAIAHC